MRRTLASGMTFQGPTLSRRELLASGAGAAAAVLSGCIGGTEVVLEPARLSARPAPPTQAVSTGHSSIDLGDFARSCRLYVPATYVPANPLPLVMMFHGAGQRANSATASLEEWAERIGFIVLAVDALQSTWDAIETKFAGDLLFADRALDATFDRCAIDPARVSVAGFSDGATYAVGVGRANGDLFSRIVAYAPGRLLDVFAVGRPALFVAHGLDDAVLPINATSRVLVPELRRQKYSVIYHEFAGGHLITDEMLDLGMEWAAAAR